MNDSTFRVDAFNRRSVTTLVVAFAAIVAACLLSLDGAARGWSVAIAAGLLALIVFHMRAASVTLSSESLRVGGGLYRQEVDLGDITGVSNTEDDRRLRWRKNGIGIPGFALGWFSSKGGRTVFSAIGVPRTAVRIWLRGDFDLLVGVVDADGFMHALRSRVPALGTQNPPPSRK